MNTLLTTLLSNNDLKSGLVVSPAFSGNTYAFCYKAIMLAREGQDVLVTANSYAAAKAEGGLVSTLTLILEELELPYRLSEKSLILNICGGRVKICDSTFVPDKVFDTLIVPDNVHYAKDLVNTTKFYDCIIQHRTVFQLVSEFIENGERPLYNIHAKRTICGDVASLELSGVPFGSEVSEDEDKCSLSLNSAGYFNLHLKTAKNTFIHKNNEYYVKFLDSLSPSQKVIHLSTDFNECYKYLKQQ